MKIFQAHEKKTALVDCLHRPLVKSLRGHAAGQRAVMDPRRFLLSLDGAEKSAAGRIFAPVRELGVHKEGLAEQIRDFVVALSRG